MAGVWDLADATLLFAPLDSVAERAVAEAARRSLAFLEIQRVRRISPPPPLGSRGQNDFMAPLRRRAGATT